MSLSCFRPTLHCCVKPLRHQGLFVTAANATFPNSTFNLHSHSESWQDPNTKIPQPSTYIHLQPALVLTILEPNPTYILPKSGSTLKNNARLNSDPSLNSTFGLTWFWLSYTPSPISIIDLTQSLSGTPTQSVTLNLRPVLSHDSNIGLITSLMTWSLKL